MVLDCNREEYMEERFSRSSTAMSTLFTTMSVLPRARSEIKSPDCEYQ